VKALCWNGPKDMRVEEVPDPKIINPRDAIVRVSSTTVCGSDLHLYDGFIPTLMAGDILGHEFMGEVVEVGPGVRNLSIGDRVVVPFCIACGGCYFCKRALFSLCDNTNPHADWVEKMYGFSTGGLFGYSHMFGGYAGGQAELVRVPMADIGPFKIPAGISDEQALFLTDIFPTGYMAAENCHIQPGDTVAVWGAGPVGQFAIKSAFLLGAERVIAIDLVPDRLMLAATASGAETLNPEDVDIYEALRDMTGGRGPDACIDAVGMEAHGFGAMGVYDKVKQSLMLENDRPHVLRQMIHCCRKGGTLSVPGVYSGLIDKFPYGAAFGKGLTIKGGQTHVHRYLPDLLELIVNGRVDPSFVVSHHMPLEDGPEAYDMFLHKRDACMKVVLTPGQKSESRARRAGAQQEVPA
jgi:threonine dehydrogenase-like Zn-dependent dehydrogenase